MPGLVELEIHAGAQNLLGKCKLLLRNDGVTEPELSKIDVEIFKLGANRGANRKLDPATHRPTRAELRLGGPAPGDVVISARIVTERRYI